MISSLILASVIATPDLGKVTVGQTWDYWLSWRYISEGLDSTNEESFSVEVTKVLPSSYTLKISQRLESTLIEGERIPIADKTKPLETTWSLFKNGSVAFFPDGRFPLETRLFRIFQAILPPPAGSALRDSHWSQTFEDDGQGMPRAAVYGEFSKRTKEGNQHKFSYREGASGATNGTGLFVRSDTAPFPVSMQARFTNTLMPGGSSPVDAEITLELKKPKKEKDK